jgi:hypothetical protein
LSALVRRERGNAIATPATISDLPSQVAT